MNPLLAQDSVGTAKKRGSGRPFPKGVCGNPGGRPKWLVRAIREQTDDGWGVGGLDLDTALVPTGGSAWKQRDWCAAYVEVSPSGTGIKAYFLTTGGFRTAAKKSGHFAGMAGIEIYSGLRCFALTGHPYGAVHPVTDCTTAARELARALHLPTPARPERPAAPPSADARQWLERCGTVEKPPEHSRRRRPHPEAVSFHR